MRSKLYTSRIIAGFTLIELMVSIAVVGVVSTIMLAKYPDSAMRISLANLTNQIALTAREAQIRGSAIDVGGSASSNAGYGLYFRKDTNNQFIYFADVEDASLGVPTNGITLGNKFYDTPTTHPSRAPLDETRKIVTLPKDFTIQKICTRTSGLLVFVCNAYTTSVTIVFERPNPQPFFYVDDENYPVSNTHVTPMEAVCIEIHSPKAPTPLPGPTPGHVRSVILYSSGVITTFQSPCPS